jgi:hypothetical protein
LTHSSKSNKSFDPSFQSRIISHKFRIIIFNMGNRSSKLDREFEDSGKSSSGPFSRKFSKRMLPDNSDIIVKYTDSNAGAKITDRQPFDKRDPWGHMAAVVHSKHGDE